MIKLEGNVLTINKLVFEKQKGEANEWFDTNVDITIYDVMDITKLMTALNVMGSFNSALMQFMIANPKYVKSTKMLQLDISTGANQLHDLIEKKYNDLLTPLKVTFEELNKISLGISLDVETLKLIIL